mmetsp:Transcript_27209/g.43224  ORF Transcript_27209/g.43224 Transcript_27209/m.43224 type:complete len:231 (+) Transcript_27209:302-994(+)
MNVAPGNCDFLHCLASATRNFLQASGLHPSPARPWTRLAWPAKILPTGGVRRGFVIRTIQDSLLMLMLWWILLHLEQADEEGVQGGKWVQCLGQEWVQEQGRTQLGPPGKGSSNTEDAACSGGGPYGRSTYCDGLGDSRRMAKWRGRAHPRKMQTSSRSGNLTAAPLVNDRTLAVIRLCCVCSIRWRRWRLWGRCGTLSAFCTVCLCWGTQILQGASHRQWTNYFGIQIV